MSSVMHKADFNKDINGGKKNQNFRVTTSVQLWDI